MLTLHGVNMSTNISKEKRENLVNKIKQLKQFIVQCPQDENTAQLLAYIADLEKEIKGKKYGLVFEEHREGIDEVLANNLPVLVEDESLFIDNGGQMNFLIEGDNLASLQLLEKTHKGKIDVIYIDPPYNTGNKDFVYDDVFVDTNDTFRHSKWLSFIEKRLAIAKNLMSENGVIFISIDDNEQANLKVLCDKLFGETNLVAQFIVASNSTKNNAKYVSVSHEYLLCYAKNFSLLGESWQVKKNNVDEFAKRAKQLVDRGLSQEEIHKELLELVKYPRFYDLDHYTYADERGIYQTDNPGGVSNGNTQTRLIHPITKKECAIPNGGWRYKEAELLRLYNEGLFSFGEDETIVPRPKRYLKDYLTQIPKSVLFFDSQATTKWLKAQKIPFDFPKAIEYIQHIISMYPKKSYTVLDFFAGSGTTGHAVMKLNTEDGGQRKFILCTNNENNICRDVTYERIKRVIDMEGYKASLKYFQVDFLPITDKLYYEYADELLKYVRELVELENGININGNAEITILLTEEELDAFTLSIPESCKTVYLGHDVLPTEEQETLFKKHGITVNIIPDYYYRDLEA